MLDIKRTSKIFEQISQNYEYGSEELNVLELASFSLIYLYTGNRIDELENFIAESSPELSQE
jgi:hypothetical protein